MMVSCTCPRLLFHIETFAKLGHQFGVSCKCFWTVVVHEPAGVAGNAKATAFQEQTMRYQQQRLTDAGTILQEP